MEPLVLIFLMFGPLWWALLLVSSILIILSIEKDNSTGATITFLATIVLMTLCGNTPLITWVKTSPETVVMTILGYFVFGAAWGVWKWYLFSRKKLSAYEFEKKQWLHRKGVNTPEVPDEFKSEWSKYLLGTDEWSYQSGDRIRHIQLRPLAWQNKSRIIAWMTYWPWSFVWSLFDDLIKNSFLWIQTFLSKLMESISESVFKNTDKDLKF